MARSATGPRPLLATAAGLVAGVVMAAALAASGWHPHRGERATPETARAAARFVVAWRRSRTTTWVVEARFERVTATGRRLAGRVHMAQRPPDRLVVGLGAVEARQGDRRLACATDADEALHCRDAAQARPYRDDVDEQIATLRTYVEGASRFYAVREDRSCFGLRLTREVLSPPYGRRAVFCFDRATGAPVRSEVVRREARDRTVAVSVRATATDGDLNPEKWNGGGRG